MSHSSRAIHQFDEAAARDYLKSLDETAALPLAWAIKDMTRPDPKDGFISKPLADGMEDLLAQVQDLDLTRYSVFICPVLHSQIFVSLDQPAR